MTRAPRPLAAVSVDAHNLLAAVDHSTSLPHLAAALAAQGFALPLARPLPRMGIARALQALPYVMDAFLQRARGTGLDGAPFETVAAPRSAMGPSVLHALSARPPLLRLTHAHLRVVSRAQTRVYAATLASADDAAHLVAELGDEGRAFAVEAVESRVIALVGVGTRSRMARYETIASFAHERAGWLSSTRSVSCADAVVLADALRRGERVLAAPFMGRAAVGLRARHPAAAPSSLTAGTRGAAEALLLALSARQARTSRGTQHE